MSTDNSASRGTTRILRCHNCNRLADHRPLDQNRRECANCEAIGHSEPGVLVTLPIEQEGEP